MALGKNKGDISRKNLGLHGVYYDEDLYRSPCILPEYVDAVREILLSFNRIVPEGSWRESFRREAEQYVPDKNHEHGPETLLPPDDSLIPTEHYEAELNDWSPEWLLARENLKDCKDVAKIACGLENNAEGGWMNFWRHHTFTIASEKAHKQPGFHHMLDDWSLECDCTWTEFPNLESQNTNLPRRTRPRPDLTYAFPILEKSLDSLRGFERDDFTRAFSTQSLGTLTQRSIICAATTGLRKWTKTPRRTVLSSTDLACFPWAVVEFKRESKFNVSLSERCYCQAANASAAALDIRTELFTKAFGGADLTVPPVIAFTCVGHVVKVWLTYNEAAEPDHHNTRVRRMVCIWRTSMRLTWGVATLRAIVINMHTWASRILKPRIQACVVQALQTPFTHPQPKPPTPDIDIASSRLFKSPAPDVRATSDLKPSIAISASSVDENISPSRLPGNRTEVTSEPTSPLSPCLSRPIRPTATPPTRHLFTSPSTERMTRSLTQRRMTSSDGLASTDVERCAAVLSPSSARNYARGKGSVDQADMNRITRLMELSQLGDSAAESSAQHHESNKISGEASEHEKYDSQAPGPHRWSDNHTETDHGSGLAARDVSALPHSNVPLTFPLMPPPATSIFVSTSVRSASLSAGSGSSGALSPFNVPQCTTRPQSAETEQARDHRPNVQTPQRVSPIVSYLHDIARARSKSRNDAIELRFSSCLRTLVDHKAKVLKMLETLDSELEQGAGMPPQSDTQDQTDGNKISNRSDEEAQINTDTAKHARPVSLSVSNNYEEQTGTPDMEEATLPRDEPNPRRHHDFCAATWCEDYTNVLDSAPKDQRDRNNRHEPESDDDTVERESRHHSDSEESENVSDQGESEESEEKENASYQDEGEESEESRDASNQGDSEDSASESAFHSDGEETEENFGQDESEERGSDSNPASDVDDGAYSVSTDVGSVTEHDLLWVIGLGSLNGYQLARASYLRELFISRTPYEQVSMIQTVLGAGAMADDQYRWSGEEEEEEEDMLDDLLKDINALLSGAPINRNAFKRQQVDWQIGSVLRRMSSLSTQFRWRCFRKTLALRSQGVCAALLCSSSFDFSEDEWAALEDSAKHAAEAYYPPTKVERLLGRKFYTI